MAKPIPRFSPEEIQRIVQTAFADRPPYTRVLMAHGLGQGQLVQLMKRELSASAYKAWVAQGKGVKAPTARATWPHGR